MLETFFAGDPANFRDRGRDHVSFRALAYRTDLRVSYTLVWRSVAVLEQLRVLPPEVAAQLSLSHHVELLPLPDPEVKLRLAHEAAAAGWSRRELREQVRRFRSEQPDPRRRGRPPLPGVIKGLRQLREGVQLATSEPLTYRNLRRIDLQEPLPRVVQQLDDCVAQLSELRQSMLESDFAAEKGLCRRKSTDQDDEE